MKLIERILEQVTRSERELSTSAFDEFKRLSIQDMDGVTSIDNILNSMTLLAVALRWVEKPRVHTRTMDDGVHLGDSIG